MRLEFEARLMELRQGGTLEAAEQEVVTYRALVVGLIKAAMAAAAAGNLSGLGKEVHIKDDKEKLLLRVRDDHPGEEDREKLSTGLYIYCLKMDPKVVVEERECVFMLPRSQEFVSEATVAGVELELSETDIRMITAAISSGVRIEAKRFRQLHTEHIKFLTAFRTMANS